MTQGLDAARAAAMMKEVSRGLIARTDDLTQADKAIGDGDHGIGMARGFEAVLARLEESPAESLEEVFTAAGAALMGAIGGAAGAVFGTLFGEGAKALMGRGLFGAEELSLFLARGLEAVKKRGKAQAGDKTMIDALEPAAREAARQIGAPLGDAMRAVSAAAARGVEATKGMVAKTGKARTLGERSLGHADPGALSMSIILSPLDALKHGIAIVHQEMVNCPNITVAENIYMTDMVASKSSFVSFRALNVKAAKALEDFDTRIRPKTKMSRLSVFEQQIVEIAKALSINAIQEAKSKCRIITMDVNENVLDYIKKGKIDACMMPDSYSFGYLSMLALFVERHKLMDPMWVVDGVNKSGWCVPFLQVGSTVINKTNADNYYLTNYLKRRSSKGFDEGAQNMTSPQLKGYWKR